MTHKFPHPADYPPKHPAVFCPGERVLHLYNEQSGQAAQRISQSVRDWFYTRAHTEGWIGVHFLPEVQTHFGAGCVLWAAPPAGAYGTTVVIQNTNIVFTDSSAE